MNQSKQIINNNCPWNKEMNWMKKQWIATNGITYTFARLDLFAYTGTSFGGNFTTYGALGYNSR